MSINGIFFYVIFLETIKFTNGTHVVTYRRISEVYKDNPWANIVLGQLISSYCPRIAQGKALSPYKYWV
jgi:hypothetical protein